MSGAAPRGQCQGRLRCFCVQHDDLQSELKGFGLPGVERGISRLIDFRQDNHRGRPGLVCQRQIPLQSCRIEVVIAGGDNQERVDARSGIIRSPVPITSDQ